MKKIALLCVFSLCFINIFAKTPTILTADDGSKYIELYNKVYNSDYGYKTDTISIPLTANLDGVIFSKIVDVDNTSADDLYFRAKLAAADFWRDAKEASVLDDDERKVLICKMRTDWYKSPDAMVSTVIGVRCTTKIECKDNRYRISVYGFISLWGSYNIEYDYADIFKYGVTNKGYERNSVGMSFRAWNEVANATISELSSLIRDATTGDNSSDW